MKIKAWHFLIFLFLLARSCFEEDQAVPPYTLPENVDTLSIQKSIYNYQLYFDFSSGGIVAENRNSDWVLAFECADSGYHIRINSADFWGLAATGSTRMDSVYTPGPGYDWKSDTSDGNPDSTASHNWVSFNDGVPSYSREVYLLGQYDGITYKPSKKIQFLGVDEIAYSFLLSDPGISEADTFEVRKDERFSYVQFSLNPNRTIQLEPAKGEWDILFSQYYTTLFTDDGIPTPYYVRGVLLNFYHVEAALDTSIHFLDITYSDAILNDFSSRQDMIGHDWKSVSVEESSNSAEYKVRPGYTYIVRDANDDLYKFRFKSYFNSSGIKGYPSIEYARLAPD